MGFRKIYLVLIISFFSCNDNEQKHIGIQVLSNFNQSHTLDIKSTIEKFYNYKVSILPKKEVPESAFINQKSPRYRADKIIKILKEGKPDSSDIVIGLTSVDISTTKRDRFDQVLKPKSKYEDWGVFGLGYRPGVSCIVSTYRIQKNKSKLNERLQKICIHEIGHNLGLKHCPNKDCVMQDAVETIKTIDNVKLNLCQNCLSEISY